MNRQWTGNFWQDCQKPIFTIQDAGDSVDTENESDILARRAMHLFPLQNSVDLFWGENPITGHHNHHQRHHRTDESNYVRTENGYYKSPHKRRTANQKKRQAPLPPDGRSPKVFLFWRAPIYYDMEKIKITPKELSQLFAYWPWGRSHQIIWGTIGKTKIEFRN